MVEVKAKPKKENVLMKLFGFKPRERTLEEEEKDREAKEKRNPLIQGTPEKMTSQTVCSYLVKMEGMESSVESNYYWITRFVAEPGFFGLGYSGDAGSIEKIKDYYAAAETSAYWGLVEARKGLQQEKVSTFMATIGKMTKDLFTIIRELRILDERIDYYNKSVAGDESAEIALKSVWVDVVEGGAKNPSSVTGLSITGGPGFVILPDLFYKITPLKADDVDKEVAKLKAEGINRKIREVLSRKLKQYMIWKEKTEREIKVRKNFVLKYLRQHYNVIKMYMNWLRPYLRNIRMLQMKQRDIGDVDIATAFETSKIELELLAIKKEYWHELYYGHTERREFKRYFPCLVVKFNFVAMPQVAYTRDRERGAVHVGWTEIRSEGYVATKDQIEEYRKKIDEEDMELLASVNSAMDALKEELMMYLEQAGEVMKKEKEERKEEGILTPYIAVGAGFKELFGSLFRPRSGGGKKRGKKVKLTVREQGIEIAAAKGIAKTDAYMLYYVFKKAHGLITE